MSARRPLLDVRDLRTWFATDEGTARAVDGVSFEIFEGEVVGLVGESGCGKSVTALSVLGLVPSPGRIQPESSIRVNGRELVGEPPGVLRRVRGAEVAMIFQEPMTSLNPILSVGRQVTEVLEAHEGLRGRAALRRAAELFGEVGIPDPERRLREYPHQLSGGLRQRVMIAMALAGDPDLLVADEPTTALDVTIQAQILALLAELGERRGLAVLLITHDLGVVAEVCHRVLVMYAGQVVEEGRVKELFRAPRHPYTRGLMASVPRLEGPVGGLRPVPGSVPPATEWPSACRFHPRCPHAWDRCHDEAPPLFSVRESTRSRCWLEDEPQRGEGEG